MISSRILELYKEISALKEVSLSEFVEKRLDLLLSNYEESLQDSYEKIQMYDTLDIIRGLNNHAKFM